MAFNINQLTSTITKSGVAKTSHFDVFITSNLSDISDQERQLSFRIDSIDLPGRGLSTADQRFNNFGPVNKVPYGVQTYGDITMNVLLSEDLREREYFERWQNSMVDTGALTGQYSFITGSKNGLIGFNTKYFDDYVGTVDIRHYRSTGELVAIHKLVQAYPIFINATQLSWQEDSIMHLPVTFTYRHYISVYSKQDQPGLGFGASIKIGPDGVSGGIRLPGIGNITAGTVGGKVLGSFKSKIASIQNF